MRRLFADTFYLLALFNPRDAAHPRAVASSSLPQRRFVTTDWVLTEVADALSDSTNRAACVAFLDDVRRSPLVDVIPATRELFEKGWTLYAARPDKDWSLTDCISFTVMQDRGISEALTGDHHFEQAGFTALLR